MREQPQSPPRPSPDLPPRLRHLRPPADPTRCATLPRLRGRRHHCHSQSSTRCASPQYQRAPQGCARAGAALPHLLGAGQPRRSASARSPQRCAPVGQRAHTDRDCRVSPQDCVHGAACSRRHHTGLRGTELIHQYPYRLRASSSPLPAPRLIHLKTHHTSASSPTDYVSRRSASTS